MVESNADPLKLPARWANEQGSDEWHMEIEHDRFSESEPFVVSIWLEGVSEGIAWDALATATPAQAREMADALRHYADEAERADKWLVDGAVVTDETEVDR
jgi:hypothetical protein